MHEKTDYSNVKEWLGSEYSTIPHKPIESQDLKVSPEDFIVIPELYGSCIRTNIKFKLWKNILMPVI